MNIEKNRSDNSNKKKMIVHKEIFQNLLEIVELYPNFSLSQHLAAILRRKDVKGKEFFHWRDEELLKRIEQHKQELEGEDLMDIIDKEEEIY